MPEPPPAGWLHAQLHQEQASSHDQTSTREGQPQGEKRTSSSATQSALAEQLEQ